MKIIFIFLSIIFVASSTALISEDYDLKSNYSKPEKPCNKTVFLFSSSFGLQFSRNVNFDGTSDIIYDCDVGRKDEGTIYLNDKLHFGTLKTLHIKNCKNITLNTKEESDSLHFESIKVENVEYLLLISQRDNYYYRFSYNLNYYQSLNEINLTNVKFFKISLNINDFLENLKYINFKNVGMNNLKAFMGKHTSLYQVILNGVRVFENNMQSTKTIDMNTGSLLVIENSHFFDHNELKISADNVKISNNTFDSETNFYIRANRSLIFSNNFLKRVNEITFNSADIEIIGNNFFEMKKQFLENVTVEGEDYVVRKLNVSNNIFNTLPRYFLNLSLESRPDEIILENNFLNCSCKNYVALTRMSKSSLMLDKIFLNEKNKNVCVNFNNFALSHVLLHVNDICTRGFSFEGFHAYKNTTETLNKNTMDTVKNNSDVVVFNSTAYSVNTSSIIM